MRRLAAFALLALALPSPAQQPPPAAATTTVTLKSAVYGAERRILVHTPAGYERSARRYPVLYLTDGARQLPLLAQTVAFLAGNGRMPEMIVVGVDHVDRTNELTPTPGTVAGEGPFDLGTAGGADRFLAFLEREVIPHVEQAYRTEPFRALQGHSFGGLFALHTLVARPELFQARIAIAPTLTWNEDEPVRRVKDLLAARKDPAGALFVTLGDEGPRLARQAEALKALLAGAARLRGEVRHLPGEDHGSVVFDSNYHGLRFVFDGWRMPVAAGAIGPRGGAAAVEAHFAKLADRLGWRPAPPEVLVNLAGYQQLRDGEVDAAIATFQRNVAWHPGSANVHDSLGEAFEKAGRLEDAVRAYRAAWEAGQRTSDPNTDVFRRNHERALAAREAGTKS